MSRASTGDRFQRLELISSRLRSGGALVLSEIAMELGVSLRTVTRDVALLREQGVPIEADRGRGGGVRLDWRWGLGRVQLTFGEAVDLLVSLAIAERMQSAVLLSSLEPIRRKLVASLSPALREKTDGMRARILIGQSASMAVLSGLAAVRPEVSRPVNEAFVTMQPLRLRYAAEGEIMTERVIEPHYLILNYPIWYVLAWDQLREDVRTFRTDRIVEAEPNGGTFRLRPFATFEKAVEGAVVSRP